MYLSKQTKFSNSNNLFYINIIEDILDGNSMNQKEVIDEAIFKARTIAINDNKDDIYTINTTSYSFVITLLTKFKENLKEMKTESKERWQKRTLFFLMVVTLMTSINKKMRKILVR